MELEVWMGQWGLPSVELQSLRTYAYVKFLGAPVKVIERRNPFYTPSGQFPVFRNGKHTHCNFVDIVKYLKGQNFDADLHLSKEQVFASWAYEKYLENNLYPCLQYVWWGEDRGDSSGKQELRMWYRQNITFPFNYYYANKYENDAKEAIDIMFGTETDSKQIYLNVYKLADKCFKDLSTKLGNNDFFFGDRPSSLDATVFAYLALILKVPQDNATLVSKLKTHDKLLQFALRISHRYFTASHTEFVVGVTRMVGIAPPDKNEANKRAKEKIYAAMFAIVAMTCFAFSKGIFQLNFKEDSPISDYSEYYEDMDD